MSFHNGELLRQHATTTMPPPPPPPAADVADVPHQPVPLVAHPVPGVDFETAAAAIAEAELAAERTATAFREAEDRRDQIAGRIQTLAERRSEIIARRQSGDEQPDDAGMLALIAADTEGLQRLAADANAVVKEAQSAVEAAQRDLHHARDRLRLAEDRRALMLLSEHATTLAQLLHQAVARLLPIEERLNVSAARGWAPPQATIDIIRKACFANRGGW